MVVGRVVCFLREKAGYEMRISDWSSDVCASDRQRRLDLLGGGDHRLGRGRCPVATGMAVEQRRAQYGLQRRDAAGHRGMVDLQAAGRGRQAAVARQRQHIAQVVPRSEEHTSELQSLMRISSAVSCLKKKKRNKNT